MSSINNCTFVGRLGKDPEVREYKSGDGKANLTSFSIAVDREGRKNEDKPLWINVTAFRQSGEFAAKYLKKGYLVGVTGSIDLQEYTTKEGEQRTSLSMTAQNVQNFEKKEASATASAGTQNTKGTSSVADDNIPF